MTTTPTKDPAPLNAIGVTVDLLKRIDDPYRRAKAIRSVADALERDSEQLRRLLAEAINEIRTGDPRPSWREIGEALGITGQRAEQLARTTTTETTT